MSTRATYEILGTSFYIHHDGYKEGAANYLFNMVEASIALRNLDKPGDPLNPYEARGGWAFAFIRGNGQAEPTDGHRSHGDTEYRYTVTASDAGLLWLNVDARIYSDEAWASVYNGELSGFVNSYPDFHKSHIVAAKIPTYGGAVEARYATSKQAETIATEMQRYSDHFQDGNPNIEEYAKRAEAWRNALAKETVIPA